MPVPEDEDQVVVMSHRLWTSWLGADPAVIGRSYLMAGGTRTVIGVMGQDFWFPSDATLLWLPLPLRTEQIRTGQFGMGLVARTTLDATLEGVASELTRLALRLTERFGGSPNYPRFIEQHRPVVRTWEERVFGAVSGPLWILLGSVGVVLLIACANVANLFMVRAERRQRDLAGRRALGAARGQLIRG